MTLNDALDNIIPFRKSSRARHERAARERELEQFIAERRHNLTMEELDAIEKKAIAEAGLTDEEILRAMNEPIEQGKARRVERNRDSA